MNTTPIRTLIVDDEPAGRQRAARLLAAEKDFQLVAECGDGKTALRLAAQHEVQFVLLDIEMPGPDGLTTAKRLREVSQAHVVFATGHSDFAFSAFGLPAVDYLLKPYGDERFRAALDRVRRLQTPERISGYMQKIDAIISWMDEKKADQRRARYYDPIPFRSGLSTHLVRPCDIVRIEGQSDYALVHTREQSHMVRLTLRHLAEILPRDRFVRVHKSAIVNLDHVASVRTGTASQCYALMRDGTQVRLSKPGQAALLEPLQAARAG